MTNILALLALVGMVVSVSADSCQISCTTLTQAASDSWRYGGCENNGATFTQVNATIIKCTGGLACGDAKSIEACSNTAAGLNKQVGVSGCVGTIVDCSSAAAKCFPAHANVTLADGTRKTMASLQIGDKVLSKDGQVQEVYMFSHRLSAVKAEFVTITTQGGHTVMLTEDHYLYVGSKLATAASVKVGDALTTATGAADKVVSVARSWANGLYNPHTMDGDIVVDGILTSTYTSAIQPTLAHYALWPVRMLHKLGRNVVGDTFASGSELIAALLPDGKAQY